jgi:hypothetical protein
MKRQFTRGGQLLTPEAMAPCAVGGPEEVLVVDARAGLTPAGMVDRKLLRILRGAAADGHVRSGEDAVRGYTQDRPPAHLLG